ncbi:L,D-transpeptidase [Streptococcus ictaluri]|uniref:L,D-transpeptidase catalytic domain protein n=1 Tax=Streptococcus ictaluri 707-05 TaxID=764299 RepID=G5K1L5_9STRE|nr:L,D-transpeptidase [Streptococcus ictaluri]EHI70025.1 L,D-transpeptidase catalytic domain protein [Streptococcus ictaluri 707-05]
MTKIVYRLLGFLLVTVVLLIGGLRFFYQSRPNRPSRHVTTTKHQKNTPTSASKEKDSQEENVIQEEDKPKVYPDLSQYEQLAIEVSTQKQEMSISSNHQLIFKTKVSTGAIQSPTPKGNFDIQAERGEFFFNASSGEGALYWVSFKDHGIYLFHSIPTDQEGNELPDEAAKLGSPASHGCIRMTREDAKWFYESIPKGTSVTIQ